MASRRRCWSRGDTVTLRVRLINLSTQATIQQRELTPADRRKLE